MRATFHDDLDKITDQLVEMTRLAGSAVARATTALLDGDVHLAESVIAADDDLDALTHGNLLRAMRGMEAAAAQARGGAR